MHASRAGMRLSAISSSRLVGLGRLVAMTRARALLAPSTWAHAVPSWLGAPAGSGSRRAHPGAHLRRGAMHLEMSALVVTVQPALLRLRLRSPVTESVQRMSRAPSPSQSTLDQVPLEQNAELMQLARPAPAASTWSINVDVTDGRLQQPAGLCAPPIRRHGRCMAGHAPEDAHRPALRGRSFLQCPTTSAGAAAVRPHTRPVAHNPPHALVSPASRSRHARLAQSCLAAATGWAATRFWGTLFLGHIPHPSSTLRREL